MTAAAPRKEPGLYGQALLLGALVFAVFGLSFWSPFFYDDSALIIANPDVIGPWQGWRHFWITPYSYQEAYEPVLVLLHRLLFQIGGANPALFRLSNLLLHWLACVLILKLFRELLGPKSPAFWLAALFAVYPSHTENIAVATFKKEIVIALCGLALLLLERPWRREAPSWKRRAAGASILALSLFAKENAAVMPALALAVSLSLAPDWEARLRRDAPFFAGLFAIDLVFFYWRAKVVPRSPGALVGGSPAAHLLTSAKCLVWYLREFLWPLRFCQEHSVAPLHGAWSWTLALVLAALAGLAAAAAYLWRRDRIAFAGLAIALVWILPFLNLVPYLNVSLVANRYIYLSMAGILLCAGKLAQPAWSWKLGRLRVVSLACAGIGLSYAALAMNDLSRYSDPMEVWDQAARCAPGNPRARQAAGMMHLGRGQYDDAEREFRAVVRDGEGTYAEIGASSLAMVYIQSGRLKQAARIYHALATHYLTAVEYRSMGQVLLLQRRNSAAIFWFRKALAADPRDSFSRFKLGAVYFVQKKRRAAEIQWRALAHDPTLEPAYVSIAASGLGELYLEEKRPALAQAEFERSLSANPNQLEATMKLAELYAKSGRRTDALALYDGLIDRLRKGQTRAFASASELTAGELRQTAGSLPEALALRARFLAKHPAAVAKA